MKSFRTPYSGYDVLAKWDSPSWDEQTREVLRKRLNEVPSRRFFTEREWQTLESICARLVPQPDRSQPIPIVPWIDEKLHFNRGDGFRYEDMPPLREAWRLGLQGVDEETQRLCGTDFSVASEPNRDAVLRAIQSGNVKSDVWEHLPARRFFTTVLLKEVVAEYYSHPHAWSEVGFGGPASPRGYVRLGENQQDPWEASAADEKHHDD